MNDATKAAGTSPEPMLLRPPADRPGWYWLKKFLVCNPFYLASAALLLFGLYRISMDSNFLPKEGGQLLFNFTSLQLYELLLVGTAVLLARRLIWYDAKLLVALENLLVLVPFMLVSQAALIERSTVWMFCGAAALFAVGRSALAQRGITALRFRPRLAVIGAFLLAANAALPVVYRALHQDKFGTKLESGAAYEANWLGWVALLPALLALANLLPRPREDGKSPVQGRRFPVGLFALWLAGSVVHLYSLGYVYDFDLHREWLAPALWVLAWTLHWRLPGHVEPLPPFTRKLTFALPLLVTLIAANETGSNVFFTLNAINLFAFVWHVWSERGNQLAQHLTLLTFAALVAAMPAPLFHFVAGWFNRTDLIALALLVYVMIITLLSRNPKAALAGALAAAVAGGVLRNHSGDAWPWAAQAGLVFLLLHSLRWRDHEHQGAAGLRMLVAAGWLVHSVDWVRDGASSWQLLTLPAVVLFVFWFRGFVFQRWTPRIVPITGLAVATCGPMNLLVARIQTTPPGVLALAGSLVLFALGTAAALTKHRWHKAGDAG